MRGDLDDAIDRAVREMLDAEPPAGFRARVLDRLERPARRFTWMQVAVPLAAVALVIIAVLVSRRDVGIVAPPPMDRPLPTIAPGVVTLNPPPSPVTPSAPPLADRTTIARRIVHASSATAPLPQEDARALPPLGVPSPIALKAIERGTVTTLTGIDVSPIAVQPLEVNALSDTPPNERHDE